MDDSNHQLGIGVGRIDRRSATKQKKIGEALETTGMYMTGANDVSQLPYNGHQEGPFGPGRGCAWPGRGI